jgi:hypothetical protein
MPARRLVLTTRFEPAGPEPVDPGSEIRQWVKLENDFPVEIGVRAYAQLIDDTRQDDCALDVAAYVNGDHPWNHQRIHALLRRSPRRLIGKAPAEGKHIRDQALNVIVGTAPDGHDGPTYPIRTEVSAKTTEAENGRVPNNASWSEHDELAGDMFVIRVT